MVPSSYSETRPSGTDKDAVLSKRNDPNFSDEKQRRKSPRFVAGTEHCGGNGSLRKFQDLNSGLSIEAGLFWREAVGNISQFLHATENGDSNASFREHRREMSVEKQLKTPSSLSTLLAEDETFSKKAKGSSLSGKKKSQSKTDAILIGNPIPDVWNVECHYAQAEIDGCTIDLGDCVYIKGEEAKHHIGRILEFFKNNRWRKLFESSGFIELKIHLTSGLTLFVFLERGKGGDRGNIIWLEKDNSFKSHSSSKCYEEVFPTTPAFSANIPSFGTYKAQLTLLDLYSGCGGMSTGLCLGAKASCNDLVAVFHPVTVDSDKSPCESLKLNHPETHVRNEAADDFLQLLKEWEKLCKQYRVKNLERTYPSRSRISETVWKNASSAKDSDTPDEHEVSSLVDICYGDPCDTGNRGLKFKVCWKGYSASDDTWEPIEGLRNCQECIQEFVTNGFRSKILPLRGDVDVICGGPPCQGISGYNRHRNVDSPLDDEKNRQIVVFVDIVEYLKPKFVLMENVVDIMRLVKASLGRYALSRLVLMKYQARLGIVAAGCYGLPQFRLRVFLFGAHSREVTTLKFLHKIELQHSLTVPDFGVVLLSPVDLMILVLLKLPQFPLPTHDVIIRYGYPAEFEVAVFSLRMLEPVMFHPYNSVCLVQRNTVAYDEGQPRQLEDALVLRDSFSDLPPVANNEAREKMTYEKPPETDFQRYIRSKMTGSELNGAKRIMNLLYDHRPSPLSEDDYIRVCLIPKRKGANFRDLPGVIVGTDNVAWRGRTQEQQFLPSGKPLVPDYVFTLKQGKSKRPFARLWWDETMPAVLTAPFCHSQAILHPEQDWLLTVWEWARLQGFPDYYRFRGTIKERYCQIGNAVAVPVGRALGYTMGMAFQKGSGNEPLMILPP
ncbi:hypothetical protein GOBAR_DD09121 [Gossypium barbadense]|nr:hypothetical protein GOBAR_DD09121 [Gossypium barbadense]